MSVKASTWAWQMPLKGNEKLVLLALADHANDEGKCWPHIEKLSEKCGISRSAVIEHLKKLHALKIFSKETVYDSFGKKRGNLYTLDLSLSPDLLRSESLRVDLLRSKNTSTKSRFTPSLSPESGPLIIESSLNHQEPSSFMSGNEDVPDDAHDLSGDLSKKNTRRENKKFREEAKEIINFLNRKAGKNFQHVDGNLNFVIDRLKEGASMSDCKMVIAARCRKWNDDLKMREYLRPPTLFNKTKFASYIGELGNAGEGND